jgi:hypothetical protein
MNEESDTYSDGCLDDTIINIKMTTMKDMNPHPLSPEDWQQIVAVPAVRAAWGLRDDEGLDEFAVQAYAAKFNFSSGGPGYVGDLYILQGDALTGYPPIVLRRADDGTLLVS